MSLKERATSAFESVERDLVEISTNVHACFEAAATATGCKVEIAQRDHTYLNMVNNPVMTRIYQANSTALGRPLPLEADLGASGGSSDMGNVSQVVPSIHAMLGIETNGAVNHQKEFTAATITESGNRAIKDGALGMAHTIIDMATEGVWDEL
jgi:metal-dependent amidase/aminoacylase/carboxypeptidase family protein